MSSTRNRKNNHGVTPEHFEIAKNNGLSHMNVLKRIREYGYTIEEAISIPKMPRQEWNRWKKGALKW